VSLPAAVTITVTDSGGASYSEEFPVTLPVELRDAGGDLIASFANLKAAVDYANADSGTDYSIHLASGDIDIGGHVVIQKNISIVGQGMGQTALHADFDTGSDHNADSGSLIVV